MSFKSPVKGHKEFCQCCVCKMSRGEMCGKNNTNYGHRWHQEKKDSYSKTRRGSGNPFYSKKQTQYHRERIARGKRCAFWKDGRTPLISHIRNLQEYNNWRISVFKRDNYTCQECFQYGGYLEVHHIREFANILDGFLKEYSQFSPVEDKETLVKLAISYEPFWDITNGKALCRKCHDLTKLGRKTNDKI